MPLTETTIRRSESGETLSKDERKLYSLAELKSLDEEKSEEISSSAYANALEKLAQFAMEWEWWDASLDGDVLELFKACGFEFKASEVSFDLDRGSYFQLPKAATVDERVFLRALKWYLAGKDVRTLPALQWGPDDHRKVAAVGTQIRALDLRSRDARVIREQGLTVTTSGYYRDGSSVLDFDYHYDGYGDDEHVLSQQTRDDAAELLSDLCSEALRLLRDEMEYRTSEDALLEDAEANEYTFNREGRIA